MKANIKPSNMKNKKKIPNNTKKFKDQYFEFYDDVKSHTHDVYDW